MIRKKRMAFIAGLAAVLVGVWPAGAQTYTGDINIVPIRLEQQGDSLYIDMEIRMSNVRVRSGMSVDLAPKLISSARAAGLPVVSVKGKRNYKAYERGLALEGTSPGAVAKSSRNIVVKGYGNREASLEYRYTLRFEPWMADAKLDLERDDCGCGRSNLFSVLRIADSIKRELPPVMYVPAQPVLVFVQPEAEEVKSRELQAECKLDFIVSRTTIDPAYMNNPRELAKIRGVIDELKNDPSITISGLEIVGYASPEGTLATNKRLSEGRATALRNYLASLYDFPRNIYKISFGGENWDGLVKALENTDMAHKQEVLDIISFIPIESGRESRIMNLYGGEPYRYMLKTIFPGLRTALCKIDYEIKGFGAQDALEVFRTRPQNLSLNEFYLAANQIEKGSPEFVEVFETAVRMYPDDPVANLNAAIAALQNGNAGSAEKYLDKVAAAPQNDEGAYCNAVGVLHWLKGELDEAGSYFERAVAAGSEEGALNLGEINKLKSQ